MRLQRKIIYNCANTVVRTLYQSDSILQRIQRFKSIKHYNIQSLPDLITPSYLQQKTAKDILQYVQSNKIPNNIRIVHALAHIQYNAFMSYADTLLRFLPQIKAKTDFETDMRSVALQQASHFVMLSQRLQQLGSGYGRIPVIPKLTKAITDTKHSLLQRIAVISLVHEGRGVRAVNKLMGQLQNMGDKKSVELVKIIRRDQAKHFQYGWKWFMKVCGQQNHDAKEMIDRINRLMKVNLILPQRQQQHIVR